MVFKEFDQILSLDSRIKLKFNISLHFAFCHIYGMSDVRRLQIDNGMKMMRQKKIELLSYVPSFIGARKEHKIGGSQTSLLEV